MARGLRRARREVDADELAAGARPRHPAERDPADAADGYPRNLEIVPLLDAAIESYKEMADFGGNLGIKVTFENHWGLAADPMNIRIMLDTINHPYCEASPDFCNWEHEYMLVQRAQGARAVLAHQRAREVLGSLGRQERRAALVRIMLAGGFKGTFALEYEAGPLNGVEGAKYLYKEVLAALSDAGAGDLSYGSILTLPAEVASPRVRRVRDTRSAAT